MNSRGVAQSGPEVVYDYNKWMGGVDLGDQLISHYDPSIRGRKMWKKMLINILMTASGDKFTF